MPEGLEESRFERSEEDNVERSKNINLKLIL